MRSTVRFSLAVLAVAATAAVAHAQSTALPPVSGSAPTAAVPSPDVLVPDASNSVGTPVALRTAGPSLEGVRAGIRNSNRAAEASGVPALKPGSAKEPGVPQMIIGGAAIVGGAIVGGNVGTIVMLGGLGFGLYGLHLYLK